MDMFKMEAGAQSTGSLSPYAGLQVLYKDERELSDKERLLAAKGPLLSWYGKNKRNLPWRENRDAYRIWISEIMLQQTRVEAVKPYFFRFMEHFPTVKALAESTEEELFKCWEGLGYYSRAGNIKKAAEIIVRDYGGILPSSYEELLSLPGIGSYTAGAIGSIAYGLPVPAVDGNVLRVLSRVTGSREDILKQSVKKSMETLVKSVMEDGFPGNADAGDFNQALIETGAMVCIPNGEPLCGVCPFHTVCAAGNRGLTGEIPVKTPKKKRKIEEKTVLLLEYGDKIAIRKRDSEGLLASLYEFPSIPGKLSGEEVLKTLGQNVKIKQALPDAKHIFSHVEWHMGGYILEADESVLTEFDGAFFAGPGDMKETYPIPSAFAAYKKFLEQYYGE